MTAVARYSDSTKTSLEQRLRARARERWPQIASLQIRRRGNFSYVDATLTDGTTLKLCRLRYVGSASQWQFAIYRASHDDYDESVFPAGLPVGTCQDALDTARGLYLNDPTAWIQPPTNLWARPLSLITCQHLTLSPERRQLGHGRGRRCQVLDRVDHWRPPYLRQAVAPSSRSWGRGQSASNSAIPAPVAASHEPRSPNAPHRHERAWPSKSPPACASRGSASACWPPAPPPRSWLAGWCSAFAARERRLLTAAASRRRFCAGDVPAQVTSAMGEAALGQPARHPG